MYNLVQVGERTYYIEYPVRIGIYIVGDSDAYIIDSGNDKRVGIKIEKILAENGWALKAIISTHTHADHIGGNAYLQSRTNCQVISSHLENFMIEKPTIGSTIIYGGYPCKALRKKNLAAEPSQTVDIDQVDLPEGLTYFHLDGHCLEMIGIRTSDDVCFLADCLVSELILKKYHISFLADVSSYLKTLNRVEGMEGKLFIPSHAKPRKDIKPLVRANRKKVHEIMDTLLLICREPIGFEDILKQIFDHYGLHINFGQYTLIGSTIRSYLSYLYDEDKLEFSFLDNRLLWQTKQEVIVNE